MQQRLRASSPLTSRSLHRGAESIFLSLIRSAAGRYIDSVVLALLVAVSWLAFHRYQGIWHDGVLYAGQAIFRRDPLPFAQDLFFAYGSQDSFTAFTGIYSLAIQELGLPIASMALLGMAHLAWVAAAAFLLRGILSGLAFWQALILLAVLPATYGSMGIFSYGETFVTARIWAEPPALLAVACILRGYRIVAIVSLAFAVAMHPVIAFPAVVFVFFFGFHGRQQLLAFAVGLAGWAILDALEIRPFVYLTKAMDPLWLSLSIERSPFVFLDHWTWEERLEPIFFCSAAWHCCACLGRRAPRLMVVCFRSINGWHGSGAPSGLLAERALDPNAALARFVVDKNTRFSSWNELVEGHVVGLALQSPPPWRLSRLCIHS
jgi:hypothetical protein